MIALPHGFCGRELQAHGMNILFEPLRSQRRRDRDGFTLNVRCRLRAMISARPGSRPPNSHCRQYKHSSRPPHEMRIHPRKRRQLYFGELKSPNVTRSIAPPHEAARGCSNGINRPLKLRLSNYIRTLTARVRKKLRQALTRGQTR